MPAPLSFVLCLAWVVYVPPINTTTHLLLNPNSGIWRDTPTALTDLFVRVCMRRCRYCFFLHFIFARLVVFLVLTVSFQRKCWSSDLLWRSSKGSISTRHRWGKWVMSGSQRLSGMSYSRGATEDTSESFPNFSSNNESGVRSHLFSNLKL